MMSRQSSFACNSFSCRKTSADRMVSYRIEPRLLLRDYTLSGNLAAAFLCYRLCFHMKVKTAFFFYLCHILKERCL